MRNLVWILCGALAAGCAGSAEDEPAEGSLAEGLIYENGFPYSSLNANWPNYVSVMSSTYAQSVATAALSDTTKGQDVLKYMAKCGLAAWQHVTIVNSSGVSKTYDGTIGLVPGWTTKPMTASEQRRMTGCLAALVNELGHVKVVLDSPDLVYPRDPANDWPYKFTEAVFYGDLDHPHACVDDDYAAACPTAVRGLNMRLCARGSGSPPCPPIVVDGKCGAVCLRKVNGIYTDCNGFAETTSSRLPVQAMCPM